MNILKKTIQEHYQRIALGETGETGCCNSGGSPCCNGTSTDCMADAYDPAIAAEFEAADLHLGCGLPTERAGIQNGMTVLDLGSGAGIDAFISSKYVGPTGTVIGLDMTEAMIDRARLNASALGITNVEFRLGDIEQMPVATSSIDRILSNCVLNLVPDKPKAFSEIFRVLKPGGQFIISDVVSSGSIPQEIQNDSALWAGCVAGAIDVQKYLDIITTAGFHDVQIMNEKLYPSLSGATYALLSITVKGTK